MPIYSFGPDSPLKFNISDKLAEKYNEAADEWFKAQVRFNQRFGRAWNPESDPIGLRWTRGQRKAWNEFAAIFRQTVKEHGPYYPNDIMDDFLVKNSASLAFRASEVWGRTITLSAGLGSLYGYLRGR